MSIHILITHLHALRCTWRKDRRIEGICVHASMHGCVCMHSRDFFLSFSTFLFWYQFEFGGSCMCVCVCGVSLVRKRNDTTHHSNDKSPRLSQHRNGINDTHVGGYCMRVSASFLSYMVSASSHELFRMKWAHTLTNSAACDIDSSPSTHTHISARMRIFVVVFIKFIITQLFLWLLISRRAV